MKEVKRRERRVDQRKRREGLSPEVLDEWNGGGVGGVLDMKLNPFKVHWSTFY